MEDVNSKISVAFCQKFSRNISHTSRVAFLNTFETAVDYFDRNAFNYQRNWFGVFYLIHVSVLGENSVIFN